MCISSLVIVNQYHRSSTITTLEHDTEFAGHSEKTIPNSLFCKESLEKYRQLFAAVLVQPSDYRILEEVGEGRITKHHRKLKVLLRLFTVIPVLQNDIL